MSHMTLEYSSNLQAGGDFKHLCCKLAQHMAALRIGDQPVFPPGGVRVRAICCEEFCIADGSQPDAGFVHAILKVGAGRTEAARKEICTGVFDIMKAHFAEQYARQGLALSLEFSEFSDSGTLKHNNLHARFKKP
jgi:5-carboxymethyl-2-hydroxymuconate isomerase